MKICSWLIWLWWDCDAPLFAAPMYLLCTGSFELSNPQRDAAGYHVLKDLFRDGKQKNNNPPLIILLLILSHVLGNPARSNKSSAVPGLQTAASLGSGQSCFTTCLLGTQQLPAQSFTRLPACSWHVKWNSVAPPHPNKPSGVVSWRNRALDNGIVSQAVPALPLTESRQDPLPLGHSL